MLQKFSYPVSGTDVCSAGLSRIVTDGLKASVSGRKYNQVNVQFRREG